MIPLSLAAVAEVTGGTLFDADPESSATGITIDSRKVGPGVLFAAFPGEHTDGARFIGGAMADGAVAALVSASHPDRADWALAEWPRIEVADVQTALGAIGRELRSRMHATVVGITGSSGKTSTKDMLRAVLAPHRRTIANEGSLNNELGLPLTLGRVELDTEIVVVEMGTAGAGQLAELCDIARPDVGVVTIVGMSHFGLFGSQDAIAEEKSVLPRSVPEDGLAVLNADDPRVLAMRDRVKASRVITYGRSSATADVRAESVRLDEAGHPHFDLVTSDGRAEVDLPALGEHMVVNALAAAATAHGLGLGVQQIADGLATSQLSGGRMQTTVRPDGVTIIDDTYNSNPTAIKAAFQTLANIRPANGRLVAVLGEMGVYGDLTVSLYRTVGAQAAEFGVDLLVGVGEELQDTLETARQNGIAQTLLVERPNNVPAAVESFVRAGDVVLLKATRAARLDTAAATLVAAPDSVRASASDQA